MAITDEEVEFRQLDSVLRERRRAERREKREEKERRDERREIPSTQKVAAAAPHMRQCVCQRTGGASVCGEGHGTLADLRSALLLSGLLHDEGGHHHKQ